MKKNLTNTMILWTVNTDQIVLCEHPPINVKNANEYRSSWGACDFYLKKLDFKERELEVLTFALQLILRDKMSPQLVHEVLSGLEEYNVELNNAGDLSRYLSNAVA
jgi:hypothetical protein